MSHYNLIDVKKEKVIGTFSSQYDAIKKLTSLFGDKLHWNGMVYVVDGTKLEYRITTIPIFNLDSFLSSSPQKPNR